MSWLGGWVWDCVFFSICERMVSKFVKGLCLKIFVREGDIFYDGDVDWCCGVGLVDFGVGYGEDGCFGICEGGDFVC